MSAISLKNILRFFFTAFALIALSACGGSSGGGTAASGPCNNITHDCENGGGARPTYEISDITPDPAIGGYLPSIYEPPPGGAWSTALTTARKHRISSRWRRCRPNWCRLCPCEGLFWCGHYHLKHGGACWKRQ